MHVWMDGCMDVCICADALIQDCILGTQAPAHTNARSHALSQTPYPLSL
jgi:hypothetical protein